MSRSWLQIAFVTHGEPFHGASPEEKALGGSETALVQMARALADRGHRVQVYCNCPAPGEYRGVLYRDQSRLVEVAASERFDVLVVSRFFAALELPLQAGLKVLWNHDILDKPQGLGKYRDHLDLALVLSRFHARDYTRRLPALAPKLVVTRNGLDAALLSRAASGVQRVPGRVTYVSRPERGLKLLLEKIWPRLRERMPGLELSVCGYQVSRTELSPRLQEEYREIEGLLRSSPGVEVLGALAKADYYRHLASCQAILYPCVFPEVSCIAALEGQALGTPVITSDAFALSETVITPEFKVPGRPGSEEYLEAYLRRALTLLGDYEATRVLALEAQEKVIRRHDWAVIAGEWEQLFLDWFERRRQEQGRALAASLVLCGDRRAAARLLGHRPGCAENGFVPEDPKEDELIGELALVAKNILPRGGARSLGVISADGGRTARRLQEKLEGVPVRELDPEDEPTPELAAVLIRDRLEREEDPARLLTRARGWCRPGGWLLLCVASGAWPLLSPGYLGRWHDLQREDILNLLPGRQVAMVFLPRGLVGQAPHRYFAGRWLAFARAQGPDPGPLDLEAKLRRVRPAPDKLLQEVQDAGLM